MIKHQSNKNAATGVYKMNARMTTRMIRINEWLTQIQACQASNLPVKRWCEQNNINLKTYYNRLRIVREEILETSNNNGLLTKTGYPHISATIKTATPTFVPLSIPRTAGAAITVTIGGHIAEIQNNAETDTIETVLRILNQL